MPVWSIIYGPYSMVLTQSNMFVFENLAMAYLRVYVRGDSRFFEFSWPPTPAGQGPCGFDKGPSLVVK